MVRVKGWTRQSVIALAIAAVLMPAYASAQESNGGSAVGSIFKRVVFDPTTYAPAVIAYDGTMRDWNTSQPFFRNGYFERNERFTLSGLPNDRPLSYEAGRRRILNDAFVTLEMSLINNVGSQIFERVLIDRFPEQRKLVRTLGWIERSAFASFMAYHLSAQHYRQAAANQAYARQMGFK
jgi:hypothetical protein